MDYSLKFEDLTIHEAGHATVALHLKKKIAKIIFQTGRVVVVYARGVKVTRGMAMTGWAAVQIAAGSLARMPNRLKRPDDVHAYDDIGMHIVHRDLDVNSPPFTAEEKVQIKNAVREAKIVLRKHWKFMPHICRKIADAANASGVLPGKQVHRLWAAYLSDKLDFEG